MFNITIYEDKNGNSDIKEYIKKLHMRNDKDSRIKYNKTISYIRMLKQFGIMLGEPYIKHIDGELWELRPLRDRILFAYLKDNEFVLLSIFIKKTQKIPQREVDKAMKLLKEYKRRR